MWTLPNIITIVRICFTPVIALLPFIEGYWPKLIAFVIFLAAAISDIYDGHLARSRNQVTDIGKLLDPIADKLLLFATLIPIYWISRARHDLYDIPIWGIWDRAHNTLLEIAIEMGIPFATIVFVSLAAIIAGLFKGATKGGEDDPLCICGFSIAVLGFAHSLVDFPLQIPGFAVTAFGVIGACLARASRSNA